MIARYVAIDGVEALSSYLEKFGISLFSYRTIDSTNSEARRKAGTVAVPACFFADAQTSGRGRMGRSFFSPDGTGLYLSMLLERPESLSEDMGLTAAAAVAACRAIASVTGIRVGIKWVNDLYWNDRKIAGILCESFSVGGRRFAVVGIGINLYTETFPAELAQKAASLCPAKGLRHALAAAFAEELCTLVFGLPCLDFMTEYRDAAIATGRRVRFTENGCEQGGVALPPNDDGSLPIRLPNGEVRLLFGGEISLFVENSPSENTEK